MLGATKNFETKSNSTGIQSIDIIKNPKAPHLFLAKKTSINKMSRVDSRIIDTASINVKLGGEVLIWVERNTKSMRKEKNLLITKKSIALWILSPNNRISIPATILKMLTKSLYAETAIIPPVLFIV